MTILYRGMRDDGEGHPACGPTARALGVRLFGDIFIDDDGMVEPEAGGMSVAPDDPLYLPEHRRPPEYGGVGEDPVWKISCDDLPPTLSYRADPRNPSRHGFVEPIEPMSIDAFQEALGSSRGTWERA